MKLLSSTRINGQKFWHDVLTQQSASERNRLYDLKGIEIHAHTFGYASQFGEKRIAIFVVEELCRHKMFLLH